MRRLRRRTGPDRGRVEIRGRTIPVSCFRRLPRLSPVACTVSSSRRIFPSIGSRGGSSSHTLRAALAQVSVTAALNVREAACGLVISGSRSGRALMRAR